MATQVTEGGTVPIDGVVFPFNAPPAGAGSVDIGSTADVSVDNLVAAINAAGTAGTTYIELSDANRDKTRDWTATDGTTYLDLEVRGLSNLVVSQTLTAPADI